MDRMVKMKMGGGGVLGGAGRGREVTVSLFEYAQRILILVF